VVDAAIVDGTAVLTTMIHGMLDVGAWVDRRGVNLLDTGAPFYDVYRCADGQFVAVGALEEQFYAALLDGLGLAGDETLPDRTDPAQWPALRERFTEVFAGRTRDEWWTVFEGTDACVAPVWSLLEATRDRHNTERGVFVEVDGRVQPAVAPRFSATPGAVGRVPRPGEHSDEIRAELGL
jgi:alpha-methylacyl-CoA racemase